MQKINMQRNQIQQELKLSMTTPSQRVILFQMEQEMVVAQNGSNSSLNQLQYDTLIISRIIPQSFKESKINDLQKLRKICKKYHRFVSFMGSIVLESIHYLIFIKEAKKICQVETQSILNQIFQIEKIEWIPVNHFQKYDEMETNNNLKSDINALIQLGGFYYSLTVDLTQSKDYMVDHESDLPRRKFTWNFHLIQSLIYQHISRKWRVPIVQGYIAYFSHIIKNEILEYLLISRRSSERAGTRFYSRGVDDEGHVSNFVQTEQIICFAGCTISNVQIRGSVPVFWEQLGMNGIFGKLKLGRNKELTDHAFLLHFQDLRSNYKNILCINLLNQKKEVEANLIKIYETMLERHKTILDEFVRYQFFDFHEACKGDKFQNANELIEKLQLINVCFGYYLEDLESKKVIKRQQGVFRVNCLDCLDRTNFVQSKLAVQLLNIILSKMGIKFNEPLIQNMSKTSSFEIITKLKTIWANNSDKLSIGYTGMNSTHSDVIREGKRNLIGGFQHKFNSLGRFFQQFSDERKQNAINILLGRDKNFRGVDSLILQELKRCKNQYSRMLQIPIKVITWNLNNYEKQIPVSTFQKFFDRDIKVTKPTNIANTNFRSTLVILSLQNIATSKKTEFLNSLTSVFKSNGYLNVSMKSIQARSVLVIYVKQSELFEEVQINVKMEKNRQKQNTKPQNNTIKRSHISEILHSKVFAEYNQGMIFTRFKFYDSLFLFSSFVFNSPCEFLKHAQRMHKQAFQQNILGREKQSYIKIIDYKILAGSLGEDLLSSEMPVITDKIRKKNNKYQQSKNNNVKKQELIMNNNNNYSKLFELDIFDKERVNNRYLREYSEQPVMTFPPHSPKFGWPDRILVAGDETSIIQVISYGQINGVTETGYHPIQALYIFEVTDQNPLKKQQKLQSLINIRNTKPPTPSTLISKKQLF